MSKEKTELNPRREHFCKLYTSIDREMFGNGVQSYIEAYDSDTSKKGWYKVACASASRMLTNVKITDRINELLEEQGFSDENVEKQHLFLLNQHADLKTKMSAITSYYKLRGKNEPDKVEHTVVDGFNFISNDTYNNPHEKTGESVEEATGQED